jgi:LuxR family maltose regulon positive regulatory protein
MNLSIPVENQILATKFYVPVTSGHLISRPRLTTLLNKSLTYPFTLVSAPAGFGKTTLLSTWTQALPPDKPLIAWVSLDEEDNEPRLFWTSVLTALNMQQPGSFTPLLMQLQSPQVPPLKYIVSVLINLLAEGTDEFVLILDDYQVISEPQVHTSLAYLVEYLPAQLHIIVATRADPPLPLPLLRARERTLDVRTDQLRCTLQETKAFLGEVMGIQLADETIQEITTRTEGWLVGLQLLHLSLPQCVDPLTLLQEVSGDQRYILDYLTEEVLRRQPQDLQWFLLCTSILERLTASLCDAVMQQHGSQQMFERLEQANVFLVSLDSKREWYRYHALFAQALHYQLEQAQADLLPQLHHRASLWYAERGQTTEAILHAFQAKEWQWAADLIERIPLMSLTSWGTSEHKQTMLQDWLEQLPADIVHSRPSLCLACTQVLWAVARPPLLDGWFDAAETMLTASLATQTHEHASPMILDPQVQQQQENLLGGVISFRACLHSYQEDGQSVLLSCQRALALLSSDNVVSRVQVGIAQHWAFYHSSANDAVASIQSGFQAGSLAQAAKLPVLAIGAMGSTAEHMIGTGQLHEALRLTQQAIQLVTLPGGLVLPDGGWPSFWQAEVLREWNQLDAALSLAEEAILLCKQTSSIASLPYLFQGYAVLFRIFLSRTDYDAARQTLHQLERIGQRMNQPMALFFSSILMTVDRVRFWLACGEMNRATLWAEELDLEERHGTPFAYEREEVACAHVLLARMQPDLALQRLEPVLQRATAGQRWGHVIEIRLLQALACQMHRQETQALNALSEAVRLAEPEGYIRRFVDEGAPMEALLYRLRRRDRRHGPTPYLDTLLAAFQQEKMEHLQATAHTKAQPLSDPLSERELEVLQLLASGVSNQEIAQELVIAIDTVKRHVSRIFSKLGVRNRVQAVRQAKELGLLDGELD